MKMAAVILAGGRGKRMDVLCHVRPKPAIEFAGGFKVIDFSLSNCVHSGIETIFALTDYQRVQMANYLNRWKANNASDITLRILEPSRGPYQGTADAVYQNLQQFDQLDAEAILILAGDHIYKMDYRKMLRFHEEQKAEATVGVVRIPLDQAFRFGTVKIGPDKRIQYFIEKSPFPDENTASMGIYIFSKAILREYLVKDAQNPESSHDFGYSILPEMVKKNRVYAYEFESYWQDIGTKDAYYAANMELISEEPSFTLNSQWHVLTDGHVWPPVTKVSHGSGHISNSLIARDCVIKGRVENSVLSPGVYIDENVIVRDSILMSNVTIGAHGIVDRCIIDENVNIGEYCFLGFGPSVAPAEWDITVIGKDSMIPAHTAVGRNCQVLPGVKPSDFTSTIVHPGSVVTHSSRKLPVGV